MIQPLQAQLKSNILLVDINDTPLGYMLHFVGDLRKYGVWDIGNYWKGQGSSGDVAIFSTFVDSVSPSWYWIDILIGYEKSGICSLKWILFWFQNKSKRNWSNIIVYL